MRFDYAVAAKRRDQVVRAPGQGPRLAWSRRTRSSTSAAAARSQGGKKVRVETLNEDGKPDGERPLDATDVILATGSAGQVAARPRAGRQADHHSDEATTGDTLPKSIVVVGGGAVGVEFASFYHDAGVEVTLLEYLPRLTPLEDPDISKELERSFKRRGMKVMTNARFDTSAGAGG